MNANTNTASLQLDATTEDDSDAKTKVYWTVEERELLKLWLIEYFTKQNPLMDAWIVTRRVMMMAQLEILSEDRFRAYLTKADEADMQSRIDAYMNVTVYEKVLNEHKAFTHEHGMTPISRVAQLLAENTELHTKNAELTVTVSGLTGKLEVQARELEASRSNSRTLASELSQVRKQPPGAVSNTSWLPDNSNTDARTKAFAKPKDDKIALLVCAPHLTTEQKASISTYGDVTWVESNHTSKDLSRLARGRIAIVAKGDCTTPMASAMRKAAEKFIQANGYSSIINSVQELVASR